MPSFIPYPKIEENLNALPLEEKEHRQLMRCSWIRSEKVHGANFCLIFSPTEGIACAKRKALLKPMESFFDHHRILPFLHDKALALGALVQDRYPNLLSLQIHGELFGGSYPHPDIAVIEGVNPIQTGVYYCPDIAFLAFDLFVISAGENHFLHYDELIEYCSQVDFPFLQPLQRGKFSDVCNESPLFQSTIPALFSLPALEENWAEGVVIRPAEPFVFQTPKGPRRVAVKRKPPRFSEDSRYHQAKSWGNKSLSMDILEQIFLEWININRLHAVRSKLGARPPAEELAAAIVEDAWDDFLARYPVAVISLGEEEQEWLQALAMEKAEQEVQEEYARMKTED